MDSEKYCKILPTFSRIIAKILARNVRNPKIFLEKKPNRQTLGGHEECGFEKKNKNFFAHSPKKIYLNLQIFPFFSCWKWSSGDVDFSFGNISFCLKLYILSQERAFLHPRELEFFLGVWRFQQFHFWVISVDRKYKNSQNSNIFRSFPFLPPTTVINCQQCRVSARWKLLL